MISLGWNKGTEHRGFGSGSAWKLSENYFSPFILLFWRKGYLIDVLFFVPFGCSLISAIFYFSCMSFGKLYKMLCNSNINS